MNEKAGFKKEGIIRKSVFIRGEWRDRYLYSILRREWKEPKMLMKTSNTKTKREKTIMNSEGCDYKEIFTRAR